MGSGSCLVNAEGRRRELIVVGTSAGGVRALQVLFGGLKSGLAATVVAVIHRSPRVDSRLLPQVLGRDSVLAVSEPRDGEAFEPGRIYVAPRDRHLLVENGGFRLRRSAREHHTRPAIDPLFRSAAQAWGPAVAGVILSGGGDDGVAGLVAINEAGGLTLAQDPREAEHPSMPLSGILYDHVDAVLTLERIKRTMEHLATGRAFEIADDERPSSVHLHHAGGES